MEKLQQLTKYDKLALDIGISDKDTFLNNMKALAKYDNTYEDVLNRLIQPYNSYTRYNLKASVRNTSYRNRNTTGVVLYPVISHIRVYLNPTSILNIFFATLFPPLFGHCGQTPRRERRLGMTVNMITLSPPAAEAARVWRTSCSNSRQSS